MDARNVLLLHGFLMSARLWDDVVALLPEGSRVLAPDLRGHGGAAVSRSVTVAEMAADVERILVREVGDAPVTAVGFSLGGYVALELLRARPSRIAALVLVATRARADDAGEVSARRDLAVRVATEGTNAAVEAYLPRLFSSAAAFGLHERWHDEMSETDPVGAVAALDAMATRPDAEGVLSAFEGPTRVLVGADDVLTPPREAERMRALARRSTLDVIEGAGHMLPVEAPERVARAVRAVADPSGGGG